MPAAFQALLAARGLSPAAASQLAGGGRDLLRDYVRRARFMRADTLIRLADGLEISLDALVEALGMRARLRDAAGKRKAA